MKPVMAPTVWAASIAVLVLDQLSKYWVVSILDLPLRGTVHIWGPLSFSMTLNRGVSFGFLAGSEDWVRWGLVAFSLAVMVALLVWGHRAGNRLLALALGLLAGGAAGDALDRARIGAVIDFIDARALHFPWIFNLADSAITIGVGLLLLDNLRSEPQKPGKMPVSESQ